MEQNQSNQLGTEAITKLLVRFSVPSIIAMLVNTLYNIVDQIFIGQGLGYLGNGATTVAYPLSIITLAISLLLGVGSASSFSLLLGEGRKEQAAKTVGSAVSMMFLSGIAFLIVGEVFLDPFLRAFGATPENYSLAMEYSRIILIGCPFLIVGNGISPLCRADGSPSYSMNFVVAGALVNCFLDPLFIFVFHWGMAGAAWATIIGQFVSLVLALLYLPRFKQIRLKADHFKFDWPALSQSCRLGFSASVNQIAILVVTVVLNNLFKYYGALSVYGSNIPISASGIAVKLVGIFVSVAVGLGQGLQPIVGFNYGAGQYDRVRECMSKAMIAIVIMGTLVEACFQIFPRQLILFFGNGDELYIQFGILMLRIYLAGICVQGLQSLSSTYFAAIGQPVKGAFLSLSRSIIFYLPLAFVLPMIWGIEGMLWGQAIADVLSAAIALVLVLRSFVQMKNHRNKAA